MKSMRIGDGSTLNMILSFEAKRATQSVISLPPQMTFIRLSSNRQARANHRGR